MLARPYRRLPPGKLVGANFATRLNRGPGTEFLDEPFLNWEEDWIEYIKPSIDAAHSIGCNCMRMMGAIKSIVAEEITFADYVSHWRQFIEYCRSLGMWVMPCAGGPPHWDGISSPFTEVVEITADLCHSLRDFSNVVCFDVMNEPENATLGTACNGTDTWINPISQGALLTLLGEVIDACRDAAPGMPLTAGTYQASGNGFGNSIIALTDFIDRHPYSWTGTQLVNDPLAATYPTRDRILGEHGHHPSAQGDEGDMVTQLDGQLNFIDSANCKLALYFALCGFKSSATDYGLFAMGPGVTVGAERTDLTAVHQGIDRRTPIFLRRRRSAA